MKALKYFILLPLLLTIDLHAQQARWELMRENLWGHIAVDPTAPNIIYVAGGAMLNKSTDGGQTWVKYEQGFEIQTSLESNRKLQIFWTNGKSTAVKDSLSDSHG